MAQELKKFSEITNRGVMQSLNNVGYTELDEQVTFGQLASAGSKIDASGSVGMYALTGTDAAGNIALVIPQNGGQPRSRAFASINRAGELLQVTALKRLAAAAGVGVEFSDKKTKYTLEKSILILEIPTWDREALKFKGNYAAKVVE